MMMIQVSQNTIVHVDYYAHQNFFVLNLSFLLLVSNPSFLWTMIQVSQNTLVHVDYYNPPKLEDPLL